ncbi:MAG: hypothetical protein HY644_02380 [Acidobacteria bacterium]|nr:hypothetical protein [Acidobacteriota bacterium]
MQKREEAPEWIEHLGRAFETFFRDLKGVLPEETYAHLRASRKEFLLAARSLIDRQIQKLEQEPKRKARKVEVQ